jgi:hypothetical protein
MTSMDRNNPSSDPLFDRTKEHRVYYLSHPLAADEKYTFQQNMDHVVHLMRLFYEEGMYVIAPYHTICLALPDDNAEYRRIGLEVDCNIARLMGNLILVGHKLSKGMKNELESASEGPDEDKRIYDLIGLTDGELRVTIRAIKEER